MIGRVLIDLRVPMQNEEGELLLKRQLKADNSPSTAFEISRTGKYLGIGTAEGAGFHIHVNYTATESSETQMHPF